LAAIRFGYSAKLLRKLINFERPDLKSSWIHVFFTPNHAPKTRSAMPLLKQGQQISAMIELIFSVE